MKQKILSIFSALILSATAVITSTAVSAESEIGVMPAADENLSRGAGAGSENTADLASSVTAKITAKLNDENDLFNSSDAVKFNQHYLKLNINYNVSENGTVTEGTKLKIELKPETESTHLKYPFTFSENKTVVADNGDKLADVNISSHEVAVEFTFAAIDKNFKINLDSALEARGSDLFQYFQDHPDVSSFEQTYNLYINGKKQEKKIVFSFDKPKPVENKVYFSKTRGSYKAGKNPGEGQMFYNIIVSTKLSKSNEFFIYDTPDVNLAFNDKNFKAYCTIGKGEFYGNPFFKASDGAEYIGEGENESRTECQLYEIYFLTEESSSPSRAREAGYEEQTLHLDRFNVATGKLGLDSMDTATVPKNILVEKPFGEQLTAEEKQKIEDAGGLNKTVGKGFKFHIKNFSHPLYEAGGSFVLVFSIDIVNPSNTLNADKNEVYYNTGAYYAQEIPTCNPEMDDHCAPIKSEKTTLKDLATEKCRSSAVVMEGQISGTVDEYSAVNFTKQNKQGTPLAGAIFSVYESDSDGKEGEIAVNKDNIKLENVLTNDKGKLSVKGENGSLKELELNLKRGYYLIREISAPEGYTKDEQDRFLTVGLKTQPVIFVNNKKTEDEPDPTEPTQPTEPSKPTEPTEPTQPTKPTELTQPTESAKPTEPGKKGSTTMRRLPGTGEYSDSTDYAGKLLIIMAGVLTSIRMVLKYFGRKNRGEI